MLQITAWRGGDSLLSYIDQTESKSEKPAEDQRYREMNTGELICTKKAAALIGYSAETLRGWRHRGAINLPYLQRRDGRIFYRREDLEAFQDGQWTEFRA